MTDENKPGYLMVFPWSVESAGGVNTVAHNFYQQLSKSGRYQPHILCNVWECSRIEQRSSSNVDLLCMRLPAIPSSFMGRIRLATILPLSLFRLGRLLIQHNVKVINIHYPAEYVLTVVLLRLLLFFRGTLLISCHGSDVLNLPADARELSPLLKVLFHQADVIFACSGALGEELQAKLPERERTKVQVAYNGIDADAFLLEQEDDPNIADSLSDSRFILSVGRFDIIKGQDNLIRAFAKLRKTHPSLRLVLVGADTNYRKKLEQLAQSLDVGNCVSFYADVPYSKMGSFYRRAFLMCLPSRREGFPMTILEAGSFGLPVVASSVGGVPEIIVDHRTGRLVNVDDIGALATAIEELITNDKHRMELGKRLQGLVLEKFSWEVTLERYISHCTSSR